MEDWTKAVGIGFKAKSDGLWMVGTPGLHLGQSLWLREIRGREDGPPPPVDLAMERRTGEAVRALIDAGVISAVHDIADGGLLVALAEMALAGGRGALLDYGLPRNPDFLFGESQGRYLVTASDHDALRASLDEADVPYWLLGKVHNNPVIRFEAIQDTEVLVSLADLRAAHEGFFPKLMSGGSKAA
jgi:phosphoribosylformylglycinamidine synthase subunit PurL